MKPIKNINDKTPDNKGNTPLPLSKMTGKQRIFPPFYGHIAYHISAFLVYIAFETWVTYSNGERIAPFYYVPYYALFIILFYFYAHRVYPTGYYYWHKSKFLSFLIFLGSVVLSVLVLLAFNHVARYYLTGELSIRTHPKTLTNAVWRAFVLFNLSAMYWLFIHTVFKKQEEIDNIKRHNELEKRAFESQLAYEHARINPHFLFNTLQYVYRVVEPVSPRAETAIANLVEMMRLLLAPLPEDHKIALDRELHTVELFFTMSQLLRDHKCHYTFTRPAKGAIDGLRVPPQIILTLAENMFKHGIKDDQANPAELKVSVDGSKLSIHVINGKYPYAKRHTGGIGMQNLKNRLNYFYPDNYTLDIRESNDIFELNLVIPL